MKNTNEKADNTIVLQMVFAATEKQKGVSVIADFMDVLFCCTLGQTYKCAVEIMKPFLYS